MPAERYIESLLMRKDDLPEESVPSFNYDDCDSEFEFKGTVKLVQIVKSVQNSVHNRHDYVFNITDIQKLKKKGESRWPELG